AQQAAERTASTMSGRAGGAPSHSPPATEANGGANALSPPPGVATACAERPLQVPGDPYSPSCVAFTGDNGGATSRGVTGDEIKVAIRIPADPVADFSSAVAQLTGGDVTETPEDVRRTSEALLEYFNRTFQLYGRRIKAVEYQGRGALTREILGGGQEQANADAIKVESEIGAFADLSAFSQPYADALARRKVMAFGAPYMSREWFSQRRPYAWSLAPDCSRLVEAGAEYANKRLFGKPAAHAGDGLRGKPRKIAVIAPDNPIYQECLDAGLALMEAAGNEVAANISYTLDFASLSNQAASIVSRLKSQGITSVACGCDPVLPVYLTAKANEQGYNPEWLVVGTALTDTDLVAQLYNQEQWAHAFGGSALGDQLPRRAGFGYHAYKAIRDDEPSLVVELLYYHLYMFALGVHQAGPNLTPETFEAGMFSYTDPAVGRIGPAGMWGFGPGVYTAQQAAREIWWDPQRISAYNGKKGAYVVSSGWWRAGQIPAGDPGVFARASAR
ncbi:MAG: ABC transporter substrate-binding protein, partial [Acidimicrobiia bacterium]